MASSPDPNDLKPDLAQYALNIDTQTMPGALQKATGVSVYDFSDVLNNGQLPNGEHIVSVGRLVYNKVWDGDEKVNRLMELVVIQVDGDHGFDWYEIEREVGTENWILQHGENALFCGWDANGNRIYSNPEFEGQFGVTRAGKARWMEHNGVLRAACGAFINTDAIPAHPMYNKSDSFPLQWRYVNRWPIDPAVGEVKGYFKEYRADQTNVGHCLLGHSGLVRSVGLPDYTPPEIELLTWDSTSWGTTKVWPLFNDLGYVSGVVKYVLLAEFDGHQIASQKAEPETNESLVLNTSYYAWGSRIKITITDYATDGSFPKRLSAFRLYRSYQSTGVQIAGQPNATPTIFPPYEQFARLDIKDGQEDLFVIDSIRSGAQFKWVPNRDIASEFPEGLLDDLTAKVTDDTGTEYECNVDDTGAYNEWVFVTLDLPAAAEITNGNHYVLRFNSRWRVNGNNVEIYFVDFNLPQIIGVPSWIEPNTELDRLPPIECNYAKAVVFRERNYVVDVAFDDVLEPTMLRYSNATNDPLAGFDLFPKYLIPAISKDDKIVAIANYLDFALILTKYKIFKYLIGSDGINELLAEQPWEIGIEAIDSFTVVNGISYFLGRSGGEVSLYVWNPSGAPKNVGHAIRPTLDGILNAQNMHSEMATGLWLPKDKKYLLNLPIMNF